MKGPCETEQQQGGWGVRRAGNRKAGSRTEGPEHGGPAGPCYEPWGPTPNKDATIVGLWARMDDLTRVFLGHSSCCGRLDSSLYGQGSSALCSVVADG